LNGVEKGGAVEPKFRRPPGQGRIAEARPKKPSARRTLPSPSPSANLVGFQGRAKKRRDLRGAEQLTLRALLRDRVRSMNKIYALPEDELRGDIYRRMLLLMGKNWGSWESVAAAVSLFGGLLAIVLGTLDWAVVGLFAPAGTLGSLLDVAGTVLFALPLPLMALGAFCLDLLEKKAPALPLPAESRPAVPVRSRRYRARLPHHN
jgi:hypothetical protein